MTKNKKQEKSILFLVIAIIIVLIVFAVSSRMTGKTSSTVEEALDSSENYISSENCDWKYINENQQLNVDNVIKKGATGVCYVKTKTLDGIDFYSIGSLIAKQQPMSYEKGHRGIYGFSSVVNCIVDQKKYSDKFWYFTCQ